MSLWETGQVITAVKLNQQTYVADNEKSQTLATINETEICAHTLDATNRLMRLAIFFRVITAPTVVTVKIYYTNVADDAVTCTLIDARTFAVNNYTYPSVVLEAKASTEVSIKVTAGTANQVIVSGDIEELG